MGCTCSKEAMVSYLLAMTSNLIAMASNLRISENPVAKSIDEIVQCPLGKKWQERPGCMPKLLEQCRDTPPGNLKNKEFIIHRCPSYKLFLCSMIYVYVCGCTLPQARTHNCSFQHDKVRGKRHRPGAKPQKLIHRSTKAPCSPSRREIARPQHNLSHTKLQQESWNPFMHACRLNF